MYTSDFLCTASTPEKTSVLAPLLPCSYQRLKGAGTRPSTPLAAPSRASQDRTRLLADLAGRTRHGAPTPAGASNGLDQSPCFYSSVRIGRGPVLNPAQCGGAAVSRQADPLQPSGDSAGSAPLQLDSLQPRSHCALQVGFAQWLLRLWLASSHSDCPSPLEPGMVSH